MFTWIAGVIARGGLWALFGLMSLENVFPLLPSELILPVAGYDAARGMLDLPSAILAATAGSVLGALPLYGAAYWLGLERAERWTARHGRWVTLSQADVSRAGAWFARWGFWAVMIGRTLPGVRGIICIPAGLARQRLPAFLLALTLGSFCWSTVIMCAGYLLGAHFDEVHAWLNPVTEVFAACVVVLYIYRFVRLSRARKTTRAP